MCRECENGISAVWRDSVLTGELNDVAPPCSNSPFTPFQSLILLVTREGLAGTDASQWYFFDRPAGIVAAAFGESFPAGCFLKHFHSRSRTENWRPQRCTWFECQRSHALVPRSAPLEHDRSRLKFFTRFRTVFTVVLSLRLCVVVSVWWWRN